MYCLYHTFFIVKIARGSCIIRIKMLQTRKTIITISVYKTCVGKEKILGNQTSQTLFSDHKDESKFTFVSGNQSLPCMKDSTLNFPATSAVREGSKPAHLTLWSTVDPGPVFWYSA